MTDKLTKSQRSENMSKIKSHNTKLEVSFRKQLYKKGIRYLLSYPLIGKPDLVIPSKKLAIFINGCFWHQHKGCKLSCMPKTNTDFWKTKLEGNKGRDKKVRIELKKKGWEVITVWECEIEGNVTHAVNKIIKSLK